MVQTNPVSIWKRMSPGCIRWRFILPALIVTMVTLLLAPEALAITMHPNYMDGGGPLYKTAVAPNLTLRVHRVGNVWFSITNYGKLGSEGRDLYDPLTNEPAPACEFPAGTNLEYLFQGCIWIGAVVEGDEPGELDTLVSIGDDGWWSDILELNPEPPPDGNILMLSTRGETSPPYAPNFGSLNEITDRSFEAISEQDFICVMTDTIMVGVTPDPNDSRPHRPLNMKIVQKSYSWSYEYAEDFVLIDFEIENVGLQALENVWIALYIDADVAHTSEDGYGAEEGAQDDICGFLQYFYPEGVPEEATEDTVKTEIFTAWIADNDAQPDGGSFIYSSARGLSGCRVVQAPSPGSSPEDEGIQYGFNWWISNVNSQLDWGPQWVSNYNIWHQFPGGGRGTPGGDRAKYQVMSNGEFDYDQIWCNLDIWEDLDTAWMPNTASDPADLANGYDTRYLYSFGEFESIPPGQVLPLTIAYICGDKLHQDPANYGANLQNGTDDSTSIATYYNNLNFRDFATNAQWAEWVYDNPGRDSCWDADLEAWILDGVFGQADTTGWTYDLPDSTPVLFWYKGDGCPDFKGPPPPNSPKLNFIVEKGIVKLIWQSINTETGEENTGSEDAIDSFNGKMDFEGYSVYRSYDALNWALMGRYDKVDWLPVKWDDTIDPAQWVVNRDKEYPMNRDEIEEAYPGSDPDDWDSDINAVNWQAYDHNLGFADVLDSTGVENGKDVNYYSFEVTGLSKSKGIYFAITAFDFGDPLTELGSLESAQSINASLVYPISKHDPIMVYPNPYKITDTEHFTEFGYEDPQGLGHDEQDRRIMFSNFPDEYRAIIRIWSLGGDLIRTVTYNPDESIGSPPGIIYWDLVSRNGQAVVSGMYLYSIEFISIGSQENRESEIGKFVIIK
ncbi:MAG: hypothetical protein GY839_11990 [candidate division Zixibacteria bacterium]|nr:hypothetical protein [candidate division Zixibacteria bacterium]